MGRKLYIFYVQLMVLWLWLNKKIFYFLPSEKLFLFSESFFFEKYQIKCEVREQKKFFDKKFSSYGHLNAQ